jgi:hypothetical protein
VDNQVSKCCGAKAKESAYYYMMNVGSDVVLKHICSKCGKPCEVIVANKVCKCGHDSDYHKTIGGFCRHCPCPKFQPCEVESTEPLIIFSPDIRGKEPAEPQEPDRDNLEGGMTGNGVEYDLS